jgi:hypothetical protein
MLSGKGRPAPGVDGAALPGGLTFKKTADPIAGAAGRTAFAGTLAGLGVKTTNRAGLWFTASDGSLRMLARAGELAPGGGRWAAFESLVLPDGPQSGPLFTGTLILDAAAAVTKANNRALWGVDTGGTLQLLLRTGQTLTVNGGPLTVKSFVALTPSAGSLGAASGFDDDQHVSTLVTFTNGTQAIVGISVP